MQERKATDDLTIASGRRQKKTTWDEGDERARDASKDRTPPLISVQGASHGDS